MSYKFNSELSENQIESDVSSYLGFITPLWSRRFRLISVDEQLTGADKLFNRFTPIYLQFKVSHGLNPNATILQQFQSRPLAKIISYRKSNNLSGNPILYFQLRKQAKTAIDLQHNILYKLNNPPSQYSLYIAPLTLDLSEYERLLDADWFMKFYPFGNPFRYQEFDIQDTTMQRKILLSSVPFLRHHVSIPPHVTVPTHKHHYSYSKSGGDVAWHGGKVFNDDFRLSNQLHKILSSAYYSRDNFGITLEQFIDFIMRFNAENNFLDYTAPGYDLDNKNNQFISIQEFSNNLKTKYNIRLLLLTQTDK